ASRPVYGRRETAPVARPSEAWKERGKQSGGLATAREGLARDRLGPAAAARNRSAREPAGTRIAEVRLLRPAACVGVIDAHHGALSFTDFGAATVANQNCLSSHARSSFIFIACRRKAAREIYLKITSLFRLLFRRGPSAYNRPRWTRARSSFWRETRPGRSSWRRRCACSLP